MNQLQVVHDNNTAIVSVAEIKAQVQAIQRILSEVMIKDVHYGVIPGCKEPSLYKPGAEKIMATFRLAADPEVEDLSTDDCCHYRVTVRITSPAGISLGSGLGECSSDEEKYKWKACYIKEEFNETPEDRRREKWKQFKGKPAFKEQQIRTNPADQRNTCLKMAKKRALIDAVLTATAASDIFKQDLEDLPEAEQQQPQQPQQTQPKPKAEAVNVEGVLAPGQLKMVKGMIQKTGKQEADICTAFGVTKAEELPAARINEIIDTINA